MIIVKKRFLPFLLLIMWSSNVMANYNVDPMTGLPPKRKVAVIDTGINKIDKAASFSCPQKIDLTGMGIHDIHGHGTDIQTIIAEKMDAKDWCILTIKWYHSVETYKKMGVDPSVSIANGIQAAIDSDAEIINLSLNGAKASDIEKNAIKRAIERGIDVVVAAGNEGTNLSLNCSSFPACYSFVSPFFHVVGQLLNSSSPERYNHNGPVNELEDSEYYRMGKLVSGTSYSAARYTAKLTKTRKRPKINRSGTYPAIER